MAMPRRQPARRKRGHSQTEVSKPDDNGSSLEKTTPPTSLKTTSALRPVKRGRARTIVEDDEAGIQAASDPEEPAAQPEATHHYQTRNPGRRPGKHVGLNWEEEERQQQADAEAKAMRKKQRDSQKAAKERDAEHHAQGVQRIAELEAARELEDAADEKYVQSRTASGYREAAKAASSAQDRDTEDSGSEFQDEDDDKMDEDQEGEDEADEDEVAHTKPQPQTKAGRRREKKRVHIRKEIDSARPAKAASSKRVAEVHDTTPLDVFNNSYRTDLLQKAVASRARAGESAGTTPSQSNAFIGRFRASSQHNGGESTPTRTGPRTHTTPSLDVTPPSCTSTLTLSSSRPLAASTPSCAQAATSNGDDMNHWDLNGGLPEEDGFSMGVIANRRSRGRPSKTLALVNVQPHPTPKAKGPKRRAAEDMPTSKSLSALSLPDSIYVFYEEKLIPTCVDIYGAFKDPWTIKPIAPKDRKTPKPPSLLEVVTTLVKQFHEDGNGQVVEESDLVYRVTRQRLINWRNGFLGRACTVVKEGEKAFSDRIKAITGKKATSAEVKAWAEAAIKPAGGEAWFQEPITADNDKARGMFASVYMLRTFAPHLAVIEKSQLEDAKPQLGALAMAAAAVEVAFKCYIGNGTYQGPEGDFDKAGGGGLTDKWVRGGVTNLHNRRNRWEEMMDAAYEMAATRVGRKRSRNIKNVDPFERDVVPPSSSPPRPE